MTGKPLSGNLSLGKILWLKHNEPQVVERAFKFLDVHAFLVYRMTGYFRTGWGCADPMGLDAFLLETVLLAGAYITNWFLDCFGSGAADGSDEHALEAAIQDVPPGALGLVLVPYWNSAMDPYWDAAASGIVVGWRGCHDRTHFYRSILEGIAFEQRLHTSGVQAATGQDIECFVATGGGARHSIWLQIIADITGKPVFRSVTLETAALGAGILAASAVGLYPNVRDAATAMTHVEQMPIEPDARRSDLYNRIYEEVYRHLFPALQPYLSRLTELSEST